jgi:hypothetical protein
VGVDHGGAHVGVAEQFLDCADIVAVFEEVGGERVAEGVATGVFRDAALPDGFLDGAL